MRKRRKMTTCCETPEITKCGYKKPETGQYTLPDNYYMSGKITVLDVIDNIINVHWKAKIKSTGVVIHDKTTMSISAWYEIGALPDRIFKHNNCRQHTNQSDQDIQNQ